jgi:putative Ca2+/H+ antiporter (TMEM165/GDT1 family)
MEAFLVSTAIVALAEMGDKTQLLSLVLAARFRKPWPIVLGILVATLVNHALAGAVGAWITRCSARTPALDPGPVLHRHGGVDADSRQAGR